MQRKLNTCLKRCDNVRKEKCGIKIGNIMKCGETFQVSKPQV
jgi:hypothetical protein